MKDRCAFPSLPKTICWFLLTLLFIGHISLAQQKEFVIDVRSVGAVGDGITNDHQAIQKAIDRCKGKGGKVVFRNGVFLTGQLSLVSNLTLYIDSTATVLGIQSDTEKDYPHHMIETKFPNRMREDCQRRLIYGNHVHHVTITGKGTINGQGDFSKWMNVKELGTEKDRPSIFAFVGATDISISDLTLLKPACWTQVYIECDRIKIRNINVDTGRLTPNRDGIDIVDCHDVLIENSFIQSEDDGICFKSGSAYGCHHVVVRNCIIDKLNVPAGNCFKLGTDGLGSFTDFEISDMTFKNAFQNSAVVVESMDGAVINNFVVHDCEITNCGQAIFVLLADRGRTVPGREKKTGSIANVHFKNIRGADFTQTYPSIITGIKDHKIDNITFENISFQLKGGGITQADLSVMEYDGKYPEGSKFGDTNAYGFFVRHANKVVFKNCKIITATPDSREWLVKEDVEKVVIE